jgi:chemotaxis-related protein WspB
MLFLLFQIGNDRYALEASRVVEVVPLLTLNKIPQAPKGVAGFFYYRGRPVPAVDLCELNQDRPARERLSTRIIVINHPDAGGSNRLLGLIAEQATGLLRKEINDFADPDAQMSIARGLGPMIMDEHGAIQCIHEQRLLSEPVRDLLFSETTRLIDDDN